MVKAIIIYKCYSREEASPVHLFQISKDTEVIFNNSVQDLCLSICL